MRERKTPVPQKNWTAELLLDELHNLADYIGQTPTADDWRTARPGGASRYAVDRVFGSWSKFIEASGLTPLPHSEHYVGYLPSHVPSVRKASKSTPAWC
jgi:hypothetical protein